MAGTKPQYNVDVYSGNHPFYQGHKTFMVMDEGQLNKFKKRFDGLGEELNIVPTLQAGRWAYAGSWVVIACHVRVGPMPWRAMARHAGGRSQQTQDGLHASIPANATAWHVSASTACMNAASWKHAAMPVRPMVELPHASTENGAAWRGVVAAGKAEEEKPAKAPAAASKKGECAALHASHGTAPH